MEDENFNQILFFRGQPNSRWSVSPSLYRDDLIDFESGLIQTAFQRAPHLQKDTETLFEKLTTFQHYGLSTRLLDLTLNPLVALYFACQSHESVDYQLPTSDMNSKQLTQQHAIIKESDGAVYCRFTEGVNFNSREVNIILAILNIDDPNKDYFEVNIQAHVAMFRSKLLPASFLSESQEKYREEYKYLLSVLERNYFVIPSLNNERIALQNGAFLLPGYEIQKNGAEPYSSLINPKIKSLDDEFNRIYIIPSKCKKGILEELDLFNINESTLFPELEHHMRYIISKKHNSIRNYRSNSEYHNKSLSCFYDWFIETNWNKICTQLPESFTSTNHEIATAQFSKSIGHMLRSQLGLLADTGYTKKVVLILIDGTKEDRWYSDEKILNRLNKNIQKTLDRCGYSDTVIYHKSDQILRLAIGEYARHLMLQLP